MQRQTTPSQAQNIAAQVPDVLVKAQNIAQTFMHGGHYKRRGGVGETFWQYHPYTQDQEIRRIDWRQSAKSDHIYVREEERQNAQTYLFWTAGGPNMDFKSSDKLPTKLEAAQCLTLACAIVLSRRHERIGGLNSKIYGHSMESVMRLYEDLSHGGEALPQITQAMPRHATTVLAGDFLSPLEEIEAALKPLSAKTRNGVLLHIFDPAELTLPYRGHVKFEGVSGGLNALIRSVKTIRKDYKNRLESHSLAIKSLCRKYGWHYKAHVTDGDMVKTVSDIISVMRVPT